MRNHSRTRALLLLLALPLMGACGDDGGPVGPSGQVLDVGVQPSAAVLVADDTMHFSALAHLSDGSQQTVSVTWSASGGTIDASGFYTAPHSAGTYEVIATHNGTGVMDTAVVTVSAPGVTVVGVNVTPSTVDLQGGSNQAFTATATLSDNSTAGVNVTWTASGGTITSSGFYTAPLTGGTYEIVGLHTASGAADTSIVNVTAVAPGTFPQQYSLTRPLLQNNPGALLVGEDWQGITSVMGRGFHVGSGVQEAADKPVPNGPSGARRAELVQDQFFVQTPRLWYTDGSDGMTNNYWDTRHSRSFPAVNRAWFRALYRFSPDFNARVSGAYNGNPAHKIFYVGSAHRLIQVANTNDWRVMSDPESDNWGGSTSLLPGSPSHGGIWLEAEADGSAGNEVWGSSEWFEVIALQERVSATHYRVRVWLRQVTRNGALLSQPQIVIRDNGDPAKYGFERTGMTNDPGAVAGHIQLFDNRNGWLPSGEAIWAQLGPYEVIDASVIPDPYGLASDML